jgi:hypothetical protein
VVPFSPILLVVSAIVGVRTVIDLLDGITDQNKRRVRGWSLTSIAFSLAVIALTIGFGVVASAPSCTARPDGCSWVLLVPVTFWFGILLLVIVCAFLTSPMIALWSAARMRSWGWFVGILVALLGSLFLGCGAIDVLARYASYASQYYPYQVTAPVTGDPVIVDEVIRAFATILLILTPFLLPIITLIYSLSGRAPRQVPHTMEMAGS